MASASADGGRVGAVEERAGADALPRRVPRELTFVQSLSESVGQTVRRWAISGRSSDVLAAYSSGVAVQVARHPLVPHSHPNG
jgi:hypothetical protein